MKKLLSAMLAFVITVFCVLPCRAVSEEKNGMNVTAHRGYSAAAPENTLAAFTEAGKAGFYGCEFDVHPTKDGVWAVMHDSDISRMTDGEGNIEDYTYGELLDFTVDAGNGIEKYPGEKIPRLEQVFEICAEYGMVPVMEIKGGTEEQMADLAEAVKNSPCEANCTVISFSENLLCAIRPLLPENEIWLLTRQAKKDIVSRCAENGFDGISFDYGTNTGRDIKRIKKAGLTLSAWTVNKQSTAEIMYKYNIYNITTNGILPESTEEYSSRVSFADFIARSANSIRSFFRQKFIK